MADQKGGWAGIRELLCCFVVKDAASDTPQQPSCNASDSDPESISDQPVQTPPPQVVPQIMNLPRWEDREEMFQKHIQDLEEELSKALKNNKAISGQLYEMGCLVFPEVELSDATSPSFAEKLKVCLESLLLERQQLEKRALRAERTVWEMENEVSVLEGRLHDSGYRGAQRRESSSLSGRSPPPFPTQPIRSFFSKIHKKSPEKMDAAQSSGKWAEESFDEVVSSKKSPMKDVSSKKSPMKDVLAKISWGATKKARHAERKKSVTKEKRDVFTEHRQPQAFCCTGAVSSWPPSEPSGSCTSRASASHSNTCVAQIHGHWDTNQGREQNDFVQCAEDDSLSTTSTLLVTTPLGGGNEDIESSPYASVNPGISPSLQVPEMENRNVLPEPQQLATMEGNCETGKQAQDVTSQERECETLASLSSKSSAGQDFENLSNGQTGPQNLDDFDAKTFQDPSCCAALLTEISPLENESLESGKSQTAHGSDQIADIEPDTGRASAAEQTFCSLDSLQKPGELSSLESSLKANLPPSSITTPETSYPPASQSVLENAPGLNNKADQSIPMEDNSTATLQLVPGEQLPSVLHEALACVSIESPQPASLIEESPSSMSEEAAAEEN